MMTGAVHSSPEVAVRLAEAADTHALLRLINQAFAVEQIVIEGERIDLEKARALFETGNFLPFYEAEQLLGCGYVEVKNQRGYLGLLAVQPGRQKSGFGRRLAAAAEDVLRRAGCQAVDLHFVSARTELPPIYARLGYVASGTAPIPDSIALKVASHFIVMSKGLDGSSLAVKISV